MAKLIIKLINAVGDVVNRDAGAARPAEGRVPAQLQRQQRPAHLSGGRSVRADLHRRQGSLRHRQHEVHDERRADHRHAGRRQRRDPRGGGRGELLPVRPDDRGGRGQLVPQRLPTRWTATAARPRAARGDRPDPRGLLLARRYASCSARCSTTCCTTTPTWCWPTSASYRRLPGAGQRGLCRSRSTGRACRSSTSRACGKFSSDRTIREYCRDIWRVQPTKISLLSEDEVTADLLQ